MNMRVYRLSAITLAMSACLSTHAWSGEATVDTKDVEQLRKELGELNNRYEAQSAALQALAQRLQQLESSGQGQARPMHAVNKKGGRRH